MKANVFFTDGTERIVEGKDIPEIAKEIEEIVAGCDFATTPQSVTLLDENGGRESELQVQWSLTLEEMDAEEELSQ